MTCCPWKGIPAAFLALTECAKASPSPLGIMSAFLPAMFSMLLIPEHDMARSARSCRISTSGW